MINSQELYDTFRTDVVDVETPHLWSEKEVWGYANDAYRMFVRLTGGIADFTSDATKIDIVAGDDLVTTDKSILRIMTATLASSGEDVKVINATDMPALFQNADYGQLRALSMNNTPGYVRWLVVGMQRNLAKLIQIPVVDDVLELYVYRLPEVHIRDGAHPLDDIEEDHHIHLLKWMKSLAHQKQDAETFDKAKSTEMEMAFRNYCLQCKTEWERYKTKVRTVAYGGI